MGTQEPFAFPSVLSYELVQKTTKARGFNAREKFSNAGARFDHSCGQPT